MGLVLKDGKWQLQAGGTGDTAGYDEIAGSKGAELLRNSASSILTGSLLPPSGAVSQANIFSAKGFGGTTGTNATRIYATPLVSTNLDLNDFSSGFTWAGWVKADGSITNNSSTIFFSSQFDGKDAVIFRRNGTTNNVIFEYYDNTTLKGKVITDSTPWSDNNWVHYAVTFSSSKALAIYKNGSAIQFDVNTDAGGSTPGNQTGHTFNTSIPAAERKELRIFGGDLKTDANDGLAGEVFNIGFWNTALPANAITDIDATPALDLSSNSGNYTQAQNLIFNCKFDQTAADGTNIALAQKGLGNLGFISGSTKPS